MMLICQLTFNQQVHSVMFVQYHFSDQKHASHSIVSVTRTALDTLVYSQSKIQLLQLDAVWQYFTCPEIVDFTSYRNSDLITLLLHWQSCTGCRSGSKSVTRQLSCHARFFRLINLVTCRIAIALPPIHIFENSYIKPFN